MNTDTKSKNISKLNSAMKKDSTLSPSIVYPRNAMMVQHLKINQCNSPYKDQNRKKNHLWSFP